MRATVERVRRDKNGGTYFLTLKIRAPRPRTHTYRVSASLYAEAGCPAEGETLEGDTLSLLTEGEERALAVKRAVEILAYGDESCAALTRKLRERGFSPEAAAHAVSLMKEKGYIREEALLLRQISLYGKKKWGPKRILLALLRKGFPCESIRDALAQAKREGLYDDTAIRAALTEGLSEEDARILLKKQGF